MTGEIFNPGNIHGLNKNEIPLLQQQYGRNQFQAEREYRFLRILWDIFREPMFILLLIACLLYFILGNFEEGIMMAVAMCIVSAISIYQEIKSTRSIKALKQFTEPKVTVVRSGERQVISIEELVPGDVILLEEGERVPADAMILQANDLTVDESIITGESMPAEKGELHDQNLIYQGTVINSGKCTAKVTATGNNTTLGKIGKDIAGYNSPKTMLQAQIGRFVRKFALFGLTGFFIIFLVNYFHYHELATSLLFALTLAMSAVPEEIPVAFSSFMALGAYKMSRLGIISRQPQIIENLGAVNVLCLDKTGTITENKMKVKTIYDHWNNTITDINDPLQLKDDRVLLYGVLASEFNPFDSMEKAIWEAYYLHSDAKRHEGMKMIHEYSLEGRPPMMTHVYQQGENIIVAAKGGVERILSVCKTGDALYTNITKQVQSFASKGYRVLGVASATHRGTDFPLSQNDFDWQFEGLLAFYDPPKTNAGAVLKKIYDAKIDVKLVTGDYPETATTIAQQVGMFNPLQLHTGDEVMNMTEDALKTAAKTTTVFARMFPDAKLRLINAIKANGEIVAMTGDGVNDGPALKASDIGIAMGKKGTETAKRSSDLILTDDNLEKIIIAVQEGRRIYSNLVKAIRYIISIHIPIILTASLPLVAGWQYPNIFSPIHVIFLELIMGPTCSIFFEREPVEISGILSGPRSRKAGLFTYDELLISIIQGMVITAGVLILYYAFMKNNRSIEETRTIVFTTLILSNVFLTFSSRSFIQTIYHTIRYKNNLAPVILIVSAAFLLLLHLVIPVRQFFQLAPISISECLLSFAIALASVMWFEVYKMDLRKRRSIRH
jgi:P-type Ca2+ transporter type 2C